MQSRYSLQKVLSLVVLASVLFGCAPAAPTAAPQAAAPATAVAPADSAAPAPTAAPAATAVPAKKTFVFGRYMDAINPDPVMNDANADIWYMQQYYSGLLRFKADNTVEADLATKWEVSPDGLTYTFTLRPDTKFADGSPITAADWQWSLDRCRNPENGIWAFTMDAVDKVETSDTQVVFRLKNPYVPFVYSAALFNCVVMPAKLVEAAGGWEKFMLHPIGSGPFIMKEWIKGDHMLLVRNPYYWETGKPVLDEILIKTIVDDNTRILALQKGEVDAINYPPFNRVTDMGKDPNIKILILDSTSTTYITFNIRNKPLDDAKVRQALSIALDRTALIKTINFGLGTPATSFRPKGSLYFNDTLPGWPYDAVKAKALLAEAGYPNGFELTLQITNGREQDKALATLAQAMWAQIGVTLKVQQLESGLINDNYYNNKFEIQLNGWTDDIPDPSQEITYGMDGTNDSQSFHSGFNNAEANKLIADGVKETDPGKRKAIYFRLQEIFNQETPYIPVWNAPYVVMTRTNVSNFYQTPLGTYIWRDLDVTR